MHAARLLLSSEAVLFEDLRLAMGRLDMRVLIAGWPRASSVDYQLIGVSDTSISGVIFEQLVDQAYIVRFESRMELALNDEIESGRHTH